MRDGEKKRSPKETTAYLREKSMAKSPLLSLKGVGEKTYEKLMRRLKTVSNIKKATLQELRDAVGKTAAEAIYDYYRQKK